jgi:hypothetical protein|tara:strand:+ start:415 stop:639 length:225 start_codon:yes stop_codon:yes gene_type:complete
MEKNFRDMNRAITTGEPSNFVDGLYVQDGRLINGRANSINGIEQAANIKKALKYTKKINMIADGIRLADMRNDS